MPFVSAGEASEAGRNAQAHMQSLMEMLFKLAEAAATLLKRDQEPEAREPEGQSETETETEPSLADSLESHLEREDLHDAVSHLSQGKGDGLVYQAEGFSVFRQTQATGTLIEVTAPDGEPLLEFEQVGSELHLIADKLSPELKQDLLAAGERLQDQDLAAVLSNPDSKQVVANLGEASPAGTRAAWVTQQMLKGRDSFTPDQGNFKFDRDPNGTLTVTDRTSQQCLLQVEPAGKVTCAMSSEQLEQFKPAFTRLQSYEAKQAASRSLGKAAAQSKAGQQLALER